MTIKNATRRIAILIVVLPTVLSGCVKEQVHEETKEELHEAVFHAGWDEETKTALQEDGSVFWSPGDEISLFITGSGGGPYQLSSINITPAAKTDFVGSIGEKGVGQKYVAVYPYNISGTFDPETNKVSVYIPIVQEAVEGTFNKDIFTCMAVSENENLHFKNLCSGIKFSVSTSGITKIVVKANAGNMSGLAGWGQLPVFEDVESIRGNYETVTVNAPSDAGFEPGKYYYAIIYPNNYDYGVSVSYYKDGKVATWEYSDPIEFKRGVFKRLYDKNEGLHYFESYDSYAIINSMNYRMLPDNVDKTAITGAYFHTKSSKTTDVMQFGLGPVYFEMIGSEAHYYTSADGYVIESARAMFAGWTSLRHLDISNFDTHNCSSFDRMFEGCISLKSLDVTGFDTRNATEMDSMFAGCSSLESLDLSYFNTAKVTTMDNMFGTNHTIGGFNDQGCLSLQTLDLSSFNTSNVIDMSHMFYGCSGLTSVNLSGWNTEKVEDMGFMFTECHSLESINVSMFDTRNVTEMAEMFGYCTKLRSIDVSNFNTSTVSSMINMFEHCESLRELDLSNFSLESISSFCLFPFCYSLKKIDLGTLSVPDNLYGAFTETARGSRACAIRCTNETKEAILKEHTLFTNPCITPEYFTWVLPGETIPDLEDERDPSLHYSTDFTMDGKSEVLHEAISGRGVEIVLMGDAYTDELIEDGTYKNDMIEAMDAIFSVEPYKSLKDMISVRMVYVVSLNEKTSGLTALWINRGVNSSLNGNKASAYALSAVGNKLLSDIAVVIISHDEICLEDTGALGLTYHVFSYSDGDEIVDYGRSASSQCIVPKYENAEQFQFILLHEFGHCFAKLGDEYVQYDTTIPDYDKNSANDQYSRHGANRNVDFTSDPATIKWGKFLNDERYNNTGLGIYEGGLSYNEGVWRPTLFSIMNNADKVMFYNVPSREAIYNRIHKLAYGYNWTYDYETFVNWDAPNIAADKEYFSAHPMQLNVKATKSAKRPYFKIKDTVLSDGRKGKMIIMD